ncbi:MAG TPA: serine/threonine-protein kinase [Polyangiaceae bacterium]|nr:serine/threonine-protein kinase [Polyangiaceae bacterium]
MAGRIELEELLGQGAMASVWRGRYLASGVSVAVKILHASYADDAEMRLRFIREGETLAKVKAPGVPQVYEMGDDNGRPYLVLRCVEGVELETMLSQRGTLDLPFVRSLMAQLGETLAGLHSDGVVHRDVKPSNILVRFENDVPRITLVDFGVAAVKSGGVSTDGKLTQTGTTVGTPFYMSPEQAFGAAVDHRSDLWAMAVVAYECLSGRVPFEGKTFGALCVALDRRRFVPVRKFRPELPRALDAWFARAFRAPNTEPFESAQAMAEAFEAACDEGGAEAPPDSVNLNATLTGGVTTSSLASGPALSARRTRSTVAMAVSFAIGALGFGLATAASRRGAEVASGEGQPPPSVTVQAATPEVRADDRPQAVAEPAPPAPEGQPAVAAAPSAPKPQAQPRAGGPRAAMTKKPAAGADEPARAGSELRGVGASLSALEAAVKSESGAVVASSGQAKAGAGKDAAHPRKEKTGEELDHRRPGERRDTSSNLNWLNERL